MSYTCKIYEAIQRAITRGPMFMLVALLVTAVAPFSSAWAGKPGAYIGLGLGVSEYKEETINDACGALGITCGTETDDIGVAIFAGYQFNPYISLEGGWTKFGEVTAEEEVVGGVLAVEADGFFLAVVPEFPFNDRFSLYGRLGVAFVDATVEADAGLPGFSSSVKESENATAFSYGLGGMFHFGRWDLRLQVSQTDFDQSVSVGGLEVDMPKVNLYSLGVVYRFPR